MHVFAFIYMVHNVPHISFFILIILQLNIISTRFNISCFLFVIFLICIKSGRINLLCKKLYIVKIKIAKMCRFNEHILSSSVFM